jgi:hypothetical protein
MSTSLSLDANPATISLPRLNSTKENRVAAAPVVLVGVGVGSAAIIVESVLATGIVVLGTYVAYKATEAISQAMVDAMSSFGKRHVLSKLTHLRDALMQAYAEGKRKFGAGSAQAYAHMQNLVTDWIKRPVGTAVVPSQPQVTTRPTPTPTNVPTIAPTISNNVALVKRIEKGDVNAYKLYESIRQLDNWLVSGKGEGIGGGKVATGPQLRALLSNMSTGAPMNLGIAINGQLINFSVAKTEGGGLAITHGADTYHVQMKGNGLDFKDTTQMIEAVLARNNAFGRAGTQANQTVRHDADYFLGIPSSKLKVILSNGVTSRFSAELPKKHGTVTQMWIQESTGRFSYSPKAESAGWTPYLATVDTGGGSQLSSEPGGALVLVRKSRLPNFRPPKLPRDPNTWTLILLAIGTAGGLWQAHKHHQENKADAKKTRDAIEQAEINRIRAQQDEKNGTANVTNEMTDWKRPGVFKDNNAKATALFEMTQHYIAQGERLMIANSIADANAKGDGGFLSKYKSYSNAFLLDMKAIVDDVRAAKTPEEAATALRSLAATAAAFRPPLLPVNEDNLLYANNRSRPNEVMAAITKSILEVVATKTIGIATGRQLTGTSPSAFDAIKAFGDATKTSSEKKPSTASTGSSQNQNLRAARSAIFQEISKKLSDAGFKGNILNGQKLKFSPDSLTHTRFTRAMFVKEQDWSSLEKVVEAHKQVNKLIVLLKPVAEKQSGSVRDEMISDAKGNPAGPNGTLSALSAELAARISKLQQQ